jgi:translation initiation factor IF-2
MADDTDSKQRPKVTLIKHKKTDAAPPPAAPAPEPPEEKKVEKKRVVVVKKRPARPAEAPAAAPTLHPRPAAEAAVAPPGLEPAAAAHAAPGRAPARPEAEVRGAEAPAPGASPSPPPAARSAVASAEPPAAPAPIARPALEAAAPPPAQAAPAAPARVVATEVPVAPRAEAAAAEIPPVQAPPVSAPAARAPVAAAPVAAPPAAAAPRPAAEAPRPPVERTRLAPADAPRPSVRGTLPPSVRHPEGQRPAAGAPRPAPRGVPVEPARKPEAPAAGPRLPAGTERTTLPVTPQPEPPPPPRPRTPLPFSVRTRENISQFGGRAPGGVAGRPRYRPRTEGRPPGVGESRPPYREGQGRPYGPRPSGSGSAPGSPPAPGTDAKKPGKKFVKTRPRYGKEKAEEEHEEKLQVRKREFHAANPVPKEISIMETVTVSELARKMNLKAFELISKLMTMGVMVTVNQQIDADTASLLASEYHCKVKVVSLYDETVIQGQEEEAQDIRPRPPVVTIMGHVDHGKTQLLDTIRKANVVATEFGGITQHIGAYNVELPVGTIAFLDTPGHEAFTTMRARGAQITDIVVLVVAANDGVMPQTIEAISHAREAHVPILVAVNKMDLPTANAERVKQQLSEHGLMPEAWGGKTIYCEVSALTGAGIPELLESILLQAEVLELRADYAARAQGRVIEARIDHGRGIVATVLVQKGVLRVGDAFVAGIFPGHVRALSTGSGERIEEATPSVPVEIIGLTGMPSAGDPFQVTDTEKNARQVGAKRQELKRLEGARNVHKVTLDNLYEQMQQGEVQELKVVLKADVHGSVEALQNALARLTTEEVKLTVIQASVGAINERDVLLASASNAIIIGFHVRPTSNAQAVAEREKVEIRKYNIIYDAIDDIRSAMEGLLAPEIREETIGSVEVREVFKISRLGVIAGCHVTQGRIRRNAEVVVFREGVEVHRGKISSLKRFKDDVREVEAGYECGLGIDGFSDVKVGDTVEVIEKREIAKKLGEAKRDVAHQTKES